MRHNTHIDKGHMHDDEDTNRNQWKKDTIKWAWTDEIEEIKNEKEKNEIDPLGLERRW